MHTEDSPEKLQIPDGPKEKNLAADQNMDNGRAFQVLCLPSREYSAFFFKMSNS